MAIIDYPNLTECLSTDIEGISPPGFPERPNGWFLKHLDTGNVHHRVNGVWVDWGLGLSFAPPTKSGRVQTDNNGNALVIFGTPFIDDQYTVCLTCADEGVPVNAYKRQLTPNGFNIITREPKNHDKPVRDVFVSWLATRIFNS